MQEPQVVILELRDLHEVLTRQVSSIQREFTVVQEQLAVLRRKWTEAEPEDRPAVLAEQEALKEKQLPLAESVNLWRERLRGIEVPKGEAALEQLLTELSGCGVPEIAEAVEHARKLMAMDPEERDALIQKQTAAAVTTPAGRLLERARTSYDLRHDGAGALQKAAVEFSNRSGIAQDDAALEELEAALSHRDSLVADLAARTVVQILRFRILRSAEADMIRQATLRLVALPCAYVVPVLTELLITPRTAYRQAAGGMVEESNAAERLQALIALVEHWRSREVQNTIRTRIYDKEPDIANAAERALEAFPGEWG
jgi:hypothetical protein